MIAAADIEKKVVLEAAVEQNVAETDSIASHGIYDAVDALVPKTDDPTTPALTIRVWLLGIFWCVLLLIPKALANFRTAPLSVSPGIAAILSYPMGVFLSWALPAVTVPLGPLSFSLNPGKFSIKEHALIYIWASTGASVCYATYNIVGQKYLLHQEHLPMWSQLLFMFATQCLGFGFAGICRRYLVRPAAMIWPGNFSTIALLNSFHNVNLSEESGRYKLSRFKMFWIAFFGMFIYEIFPSLVAPYLTSVTLLCLIAPADNRAMRILGSSAKGMGIFSFDFDWNEISMFSPITTPLWALMNNMIGVIFFTWILGPILWSANAFGIDQKIFPVNTMAMFNSTGHMANPFSFVNHTTLNLDEDVYGKNAPFRITTLFALNYLNSFMVFGAVLSHIALWHGKDILNRFRSAVKDLDKEDIHAQLMDAYPEVPDYWFFGVLISTSVASFVTCQWGGFELPWWGLVLSLMLTVINLVPNGIIYAISGMGMGLNVISEFLIGLIIPGQMIAVTTFKTFTTDAASQALSLVADLKLGHYMKIPPRAMFITQLMAAIVAGFGNLLVSELIIEQMGRSETKLIDPNDPTLGYDWKIFSEPIRGFKSTGFNTFTNAGAIWGAIGPARFFGPKSPYFSLLLGFPIGALLPMIPYFLHRKFPTSFWHLINFPVILAPSTAVGYPTSMFTVPIILGILFNYVIKRRNLEWWKKYVYTISAGWDSGACALLILLFAMMQWWNVNIEIPTYFLNPGDDGCDI